MGVKKRDHVQIKRERPIGILHVRKAEEVGELARYWPSADLEPFVEHYWSVRWDLRDPQVAETVPVPSIHMALEPGSAEIYGVMQARFTRRLSGRGRVLGTRFWPAAFRTFLNAPVSTLTNRHLTLPDVFGTGAETLGERALRH
jgi:hypothetical protein